MGQPKKSKNNGPGGQTGHRPEGPPKERTPTRQLLRPTSPTGALASGTGRLRADSPIGRPGPKRYFLLRPRVSDRRLVGSLLTALLRLARPVPTGAIRPGIPARKGPGANRESSTQSQDTVPGPYPVRLREQCSTTDLTQTVWEVPTFVSTVLSAPTFMSTIL